MGEVGFISLSLKAIKKEYFFSPFCLNQFITLESIIGQNGWIITIISWRKLYMSWGYYKYVFSSVLRLPNEFWNSNWFFFAKVCFKIYIGSICLEMYASPSQDMKGDISCSIFVVVGIWRQAGIWIAVRVCGLDYWWQCKLTLNI